MRGRLAPNIRVRACLPCLPLFLLPAALAWSPPSVVRKQARGGGASPWLSGASPRLVPPARGPALRGGCPGHARTMSGGAGGSGGSGGGGMIRTPQGMISEKEATDLFEMAGFTPPPNVSVQDAFGMLMQIVQEQMREEQRLERAGRGRTAQLPEPRTQEAAEAVLAQHGASVVPISPCGCEVKGLDLTKAGGKLEPDVAGALELLMAVHGFALFRNQGNEQNESGIKGQYLTAEVYLKNQHPILYLQH
jgi:hypothetical protein